jgi:hypothetical protein
MCFSWHLTTILLQRDPNPPLVSANTPINPPEEYKSWHLTALYLYKQLQICHLLYRLLQDPPSICEYLYKPAKGIQELVLDYPCPFSGICEYPHEPAGDIHGAGTSLPYTYKYRTPYSFLYSL